MNGLSQIRTAVIEALTGAGVPAAEAYPGDAKKYTGPVVTVDVAEAEGKALGLGNYLGEYYDETAGTVRELYGKQMDVTISLEVRASLATDCETTMEAAADALMGALPSGLKPGELAWGAANWDGDSGLFLRRGSLRCRAIFTAKADEESGTLLDFTLKGVIRT